MCFTDVISRDLGIGIVDGYMSTILKSTRQIPCSETKVYYTSKDKQKSMFFPVYEGEHPKVENNHFLGYFVLDLHPSLHKLDKGDVKADVTFSVDQNGLLEMTAKVKNLKNNEIKADINLRRTTEPHNYTKMAARIKKLQKIDANLEAAKDYSRTYMGSKKELKTWQTTTKKKHKA